MQYKIKFVERQNFKKTIVDLSLYVPTYRPIEMKFRVIFLYAYLVKSFPFLTSGTVLPVSQIWVGIEAKTDRTWIN